MLAYFKMLPLIAVVSAGGYFYHNYKINEYERIVKEKNAIIARYEANVQTMKEINERNKEAITKLKQDAIEQREAYDSLSQNFSRVTRERDEYLSIFRRHNLTKLARIKPGLIEPRINKGTEDVFRQIEEDSREVKNANP